MTVHGSRRRRSLAIAGLAALVAVAPNACAAGLKVKDVVGQADVRSNAPNANGLDASGLHTPGGVAFTAAGDLFVADVDNDRVLGYRSPLREDAVADVVIGQPDFTTDETDTTAVSAATLRTPVGVAVDAAGNLYVGDTGNNRVLQYDDPFLTDAVADRVFGQTDFAGSAPNANGPSAGSLHFPSGVAVDANGALWIADTGNNRVLRVERPLESNAPTADVVLGQPDFTSVGANTNGPSAASLDGPYGVAVEANGRVWVSDLGNNRVLAYDDPARTDAVADLALGQADYASVEPNRGGEVDASGLRMPAGVAVDADGDLYVSDYGNNRVLLFRAAAVDDSAADRVWGQKTFSTAEANADGVTKKSANRPTGVALDGSGRVAIADGFNNRVLLCVESRPAER